MADTPRWRHPVRPVDTPAWAKGWGGTPIDGRNPPAIEHLCARDLLIHDGPVDECCADLWRDEGVDPAR